MQGAQVQALIREDPTCCRQLSLCATPTEPRVPRAHGPQQVKPLHEKPAPCNKRAAFHSPQPENSRV